MNNDAMSYFGPAAIINGFHHVPFAIVCAGTLVAFAYWLLLFPSDSDTVRGVSLGLSIIEHGLMFVFIWIELFVVYHQ
jgi:hypothetical protein